MNDSTLFLLNELKQYRYRGYTLCPDTNFFMESPEVIQELSNEKIRLSQIVYDELDKSKLYFRDSQPNKSEKGYKARNGFTAIDNVKAKIIKKPDHAYLRSKELPISNDAYIVANYLLYMEKTNDSVIFLTHDKGARILARTVGLPVSEHDIERYFKLKNTNDTGSIDEEFEKEMRTLRGDYRMKKAFEELKKEFSAGPGTIEKSRKPKLYSGLGVGHIENIFEK